MSKHYNQGVYHPVNRHKYVGDEDPKYLSGWEHRSFIKLDHSDRVIKWSANKISIPYVYNVDNKNHRYYTDIIVEFLNADNKIEKFILEIKPEKQVSPPKQPKNRTAKALRNYNYAVLEYNKNISKWVYADNYCRSNGMRFVIISEKGIFVMDGRTAKKVSNKSFF